MPVTFRIDKTLHIVFTRAEGVLTALEISDHQQALLQDPDFDPSFDQLIDGTEITAVGISTAEIRRLASTKMFGEGSRRAFVVPRPAIYGVFRMAQILRDAEPDSNKIFRDMEEAKKWLGLSSD